MTHQAFLETHQAAYEAIKIIGGLFLSGGILCAQRPNGKIIKKACETLPKVLPKMKPDCFVKTASGGTKQVMRFAGDVFRKAA